MNEELLKKMEALGLNDVGISDSESNGFWEGAVVGDPKCRLVVVIQLYTPETVDFVEEPVWSCGIYAVPESIPEDQRTELKKRIDIDPEQDIISWDLYQYGRCAPLAEMDQDDPDFTAWLAKELPLIENLFGFYMDKPVDRMGTTGWERLGMK